MRCLRKFSILLIIFFSGIAYSSAQHSLQEPSTEVCNEVAENVKCEARCFSKIGDLCLIQRVKFSGEVSSSAVPMFYADFQTCKSAGVDISIKSLFLEMTNPNSADGGVHLFSRAESDVDTIHILTKENLTASEGYKTYVSRVHGQRLLSSGNGIVIAAVHLMGCSQSSDKRICKISGTIEAVTDPNIRCELRDKTQPGAYLEQRNSINLDPPVLLSPYTFN